MTEMGDNHKFYEMTGRVHKLMDEKTFPSGFRKRDLILTDDIVEDERYRRYIPISFKRNRTDLIKTLSEGQRVKIIFALDGHEYEGRYFPELAGIKVEYLADDVPEAAEPPPEAAYEAAPSDLPF